MDRRQWIVCGVMSLVLVVGLGQGASAFFVDSDKTLEVIGKAQTRASLRLQESEGFTYPTVYPGNLVQHRNLGLIEVNHDLKNLTNSLGLLYPFKALDVKVKYHIVGRFLYEGIYDYGPEAFQTVQDNDKANIDKFKQSYKLWECYVDMSHGPLFFRVGRQNLSWGETDIFRLLDLINPLDNTFGGPFEDLDDRRVPLWMLRGSYNLGNVGPVSSLTMEGFWVPGFWDAHVGPWAPYGTAYGAPLPAVIVPTLRIKTPDTEMDASRWGGRLQGLLGSNLSVAIAGYASYLDLPTLRTEVIGHPALLTSLSDMQIWGEFPKVHVVGASANYWEPLTDTVFRGEVAGSLNEPVFIPQQNLSTLFGPVLPLPPAVLDLAAKLLGVDIRDLGLYGLPINPQSGTTPTKNVLRYMLGFDKQIWIRPLNKTNTFFLSGQYFGQFITGYDPRLKQEFLNYPSLTNYSGLYEFENVFTALVNTMYINGKLQPQIAAAYDVRGAVLVQPSINYIWEPFRFMIQYSAIEGNFTNFGAFRDRDQITFILSYLLN